MSIHNICFSGEIRKLHGLDTTPIDLELCLGFFSIHSIRLPYSMVSSMPGFGNFRVDM